MIYAEVLAFMAYDLLTHKPNDPIEHLLRTTLTFPFFGRSDGASSPPPPAPPAAKAERHAPQALPTPFRRFSLADTVAAASAPLSAKKLTTLPLDLLDSIGQGMDLACCTYDLVPAFGARSEASHSATHRLMQFLTSPSTNLMIIVGGSDSMDYGAKKRQMELTEEAALALSASNGINGGASNNSSNSTSTNPDNAACCAGGGIDGGGGHITAAAPGTSCDCSGSGKSRLCRWLQFPGHYFHGREIFRVDSSNVHNLLEFLAAAPEAAADEYENRLEMSLSAPELGGGGGDGSPGSTTSGPGTHRPRFGSRRSSLVGPPSPTTAASSQAPGATTDATSSRPQQRGSDGLPVRSMTTTTTIFDGMTTTIPTLTLIDNVEPPHIVLHALLQNNYFKNPEGAPRGTHKTILFTRPNVFYKFPLQCPILQLVRRSVIPGKVEEASPLMSATKLPSFSAMVGPADTSPPPVASFFPRRATLGPDDATVGEGATELRAGGKVRKPRRISFAPDGGSDNDVKESPETSPQQLSHSLPPALYKGVAYRENDCGALSGTGCRAIIGELQDYYMNMVEGINASILAITGQPSANATAIADLIQVPNNLSNSETFRKLKLSRSTVERSIAHFLVHHETIPLFDLSEFPRILQEMVAIPRARIYLHKYYNKIKYDLTRHVVSRLVIGNFLSIIITAQQSLAPFALPVTASDALQLYLNTFCNVLRRGESNSSSGHPEGGVSPVSPPSNTDLPPAVSSSGGALQAPHALHGAAGGSNSSLRHREVSFASQELSSPVSSVQPHLSFTEREAVGTRLASLLCETLTYLSIENIVVERSVKIHTAVPPLVAHLLLDARGADISSDLLAVLTKGTTRHQLRRHSVTTETPGQGVTTAPPHLPPHHGTASAAQQMAASLSPTASAGETPLVPSINTYAPPSGLELHATATTAGGGPHQERRATLTGARRVAAVNPIVLTSDVTEVGRVGYQEKKVRQILMGADAAAASGATSTTGSLPPPTPTTNQAALYCFSLNLIVPGIRGVLLVERGRIFAQAAFGIAEEHSHHGHARAAPHHHSHGGDRGGASPISSLGGVDLTAPRDGHSLLWSIEFEGPAIRHAALHTPPRALDAQGCVVVHTASASASDAMLSAPLTSHDSDEPLPGELELLSLTMEDGSVIVICPEEIPLGSILHVRCDDGAATGVTPRPPTSANSGSSWARQQTSPTSDDEIRGASSGNPTDADSFSPMVARRPEQQAQRLIIFQPVSLDGSGSNNAVQIPQPPPPPPLAPSLMQRRNLSNVGLHIVNRNESWSSSVRKSSFSSRGARRFADDFIERIGSKRTSTDDPLMTSVSEKYVAIAGQDTDLVVVTRHRFSAEARAAEAAATQSSLANSGLAAQENTSISSQPEDNLASPVSPADDTSPTRRSPRWTRNSPPPPPPALVTSFGASINGAGEAVGAREGSSSGDDEQRVIIQADASVTCICVVDEKYVAVGVEGGGIQIFDIVTGAEQESFSHHESNVTVIRGLERVPVAAPPAPAAPALKSNGSADAAHTLPPKHGRADRHASFAKQLEDTRRGFFITGSDDTTMSIFCVDDLSLVRSIRVHHAPVIDIAANCAQTHNVIVSLDRTGTIVVQTNDPAHMGTSGRVLWTTSMSNLKGIHLCVDATWLLCNRSDTFTGGVPLAVPIAEWVRLGTGQFHSRAISTMHISHNERYLLTGGEDGVIFVWDLQDNMRYVTSHRQHPSNVTITAISTSRDSTRVLSADESKFILMWTLRTGEGIKIVERGGGDFARFIAHDYFITRSPAKGLKVWNDREQLVVANPRLTKGVIDTFYLSADDYQESFADLAVKWGEIPRSPTANAAVVAKGFKVDGQPPIADPEDSIDSTTAPALTLPAAKAESDVKFPESLSALPTVEPDAAHTHAPTPQELINRAMLERFFIGVTSDNPLAEEFRVDIFQLARLSFQAAQLRLECGDIEDEFSDEDEEVKHSDTINTFKFLPPRRSHGPDSQHDPFYTPTLFLAATGACDLTTIVWNWRKGVPLFLLQHTAFVNDLAFWYPPPFLLSVERLPSAADAAAGAHGAGGGIASEISFSNVAEYESDARRRASAFAAHNMELCLEDAHPLTLAEKAFLARYDHGQDNSNGVVCMLVTCQDTDDKNVTLRVFEIRVKNARKRRQVMRSTSRNFSYTSLECLQVDQIASPGTTTSVQSIAVRLSDGLVCTGHDKSCEVVFWKWLPNSHDALHKYTSSRDFFDKVNSPTVAGGSARRRSHLAVLGGRRSTANLLGVGVSKPRNSSIVSVTGVGDKQFSFTRVTTEAGDDLPAAAEAAGGRVGSSRRVSISRQNSDDVKIFIENPDDDDEDSDDDESFGGELLRSLIVATPLSPGHKQGDDTVMSSASPPAAAQPASEDDFVEAPELAAFTMTLRPLRRIVSRI